MSVGIRTCRRVMAIAMVLMVAIAFTMPEQAHAARKPGKVKSLRVMWVDYGSVGLKWGKVKKAKKYEVYRATSRTGKYTKIKTVKGTSVTSSGLKTDNTYWYKVRAVRGGKKGKYSAVVSGTTKLRKPSFGARSTQKGAELIAEPVKGADGYIFYRNGEEIKKQKGSTYVDSDMTAFKSYSYKAVAYRVSDGATHYSAYSRTVKAGWINAEIDLVDFAEPGTLNPANDFRLAGKIKSNVNMTGVEIGIVNKSNNEWVGNQKYEAYDLNTKEIDVADANEDVHFDGLGGGTYRYRIYVHFGDGLVYTLENYKFTVRTSTGAMAAVVWAKGIANDNSFNYGTKGPANHRGCYFCKTFGVKKRHLKRQGKKWTKAWEKTYCCNPFIFAAYAHGAQNPKVLAACKKGKCGGMNPSDWTTYKCFNKVGLAKKVTFSDLSPGDVIISKKTKKGETHHVWMYCGGNQLVEASGGGWGKNSIAVKNSAKSKYTKYQKFSKCYVMRYTGK